MCIIYKSVEDFVKNVLFLVFPSFFGDIYKYVNEFINVFEATRTLFFFESKSLYKHRIL